MNSHTANYTWNVNSTAQSVASGLAAAMQTSFGSFLNIKTDGDINVLVSSSTGSSTDWTITTSETYDTTDFSRPSFTASASPAMTDGNSTDASHGIIYSYYVPTGGYAPNGNILVHSDSVMGDWYFAYDAVDRLTAATPDVNAPSQYVGNFMCWTYDAFGNRTMESFSTVPCTGSPTPQVLNTYNPVNNQISSSTLSSATLTAGSYIYDASGNTLFDGNN